MKSLCPHIYTASRMPAQCFVGFEAYFQKDVSVRPGCVHRVLPSTLGAMGSYQVVLALVAAVCVSGCVYPPAKDGRTGAELLGPISMGTTRQPVVGGCYTTFMYSGGCDLIFTDRFGRHVDGHRLANELDQTAKHIGPLAPWLSRSLNDSSKLPYDLYLLTISPAIVLAVPLGASRTSCSSVYDQGCIQSQGFRGQAYWYRNAPAIRTGSFWYSVDGDKHHQIDVGLGRVEITTGGAVLELVADGNIWTVRRTK